MRDIGFDFYWADPYCGNIFAKGFEFNDNINSIELITTFESFEHFPNPIDEIGRMFGISKNILFTTEVLPTILPELKQWEYYGFEHGQHISFYTFKTLTSIAQKYQVNIYSNKLNFHLFTSKKINPVYFNFLLKLSTKGLSTYVKNKMVSKTLKDANVLKRIDL